MIRREWEGDFVLIPQPEHARLSGVLAEHWGAGEFVRPEPWDEVLLATYEHDEGWVEWEKRPTLDADHFLVNFNRTPLEVTIDNFRRTVEKAYTKGRPYAAALAGRRSQNPRLCLGTGRQAGGDLPRIGGSAGIRAGDDG